MAYSKTRNGGIVENGIPEHQIRNGKTWNTKLGILKVKILNVEHQISKGKIRNTNLWNQRRLQSSIIGYTCQLWRKLNFLLQIFKMYIEYHRQDTS